MNRRTLIPMLVLSLAVVLASQSRVATAQAKAARGAKPAGGAFAEAAKRAKETGQPLVVFGVSETCSRCQALKQGLASNPEFKLLMTQYVAAEVPFGGREFVSVFEETVKQDAKFRQAIGAPAVFIFTASGEAVYAGPGRASGMAAGDELKKLLISGIDKNGGVRLPATSAKSSSATLAADLSQARKLLGEKQTLKAAALLAKHVQPAAETSEEVAKVIELTGLTLAKSKTEEQLDSLVAEVSEKGKGLVQSAVEAAGTGKATQAAVQLAELERVFSGFPSFADTFEPAWKTVQEKSTEPSLREQARQIDTARQAESNADPAEAIEIYQRVIADYPNTEAAKLSQRRITQLRSGKAAQSRLWKSKNGKFSMSAVLVSSDGTTVKLRSSEGKEIAVPLASLSAEDQEFLRAVRNE